MQPELGKRGQWLGRRTGSGGQKKGVRGRKAKALVKILALSPRDQLGREQLMELLWPDLDPELSSNNLNKVIHAARRTLEPDLKAGAESRFNWNKRTSAVIRKAVEQHTENIDAYQHYLRGRSWIRCR